MTVQVGPPLTVPQVEVGPAISLGPSSGAGATVGGVSLGPAAQGTATIIIHEGGGDDMYYEQDFTVPASTWAITHNFGKSPNVRIIDHLGNTAYPGTQDSEDCNTVYVEWPAPMTGKAICS